MAGWCEEGSCRGVVGGRERGACCFEAVGAGDVDVVGGREEEDEDGAVVVEVAVDDDGDASSGRISARSNCASIVAAVI